ncbi:hypothetical protein J6590_053134 [Homalodisca vitripennis]|nr:hypothetical protein J6590_053134 [Homalodisca vitripennis]
MKEHCQSSKLKSEDDIHEDRNTKEHCRVIDRNYYPWVASMVGIRVWVRPLINQHLVNAPPQSNITSMLVFIRGLVALNIFYIEITDMGKGHVTSTAVTKSYSVTSLSVTFVINFMNTPPRHSLSLGDVECRGRGSCCSCMRHSVKTEETKTILDKTIIKGKISVQWQ